MCVYWGGRGAGGELTARADGEWARTVEPSAALGRVRGGWGRSGRDGALGRVRAGGWGGAGRGGVGVGGGEFGRRRLWRGRWRGRRLLKEAVVCVLSFVDEGSVALLSVSAQYRRGVQAKPLALFVCRAVRGGRAVTTRSSRVWQSAAGWALAPAPPRPGRGGRNYSISLPIFTIRQTALEPMRKKPPTL